MLLLDTLLTQQGITIWIDDKRQKNDQAIDQMWDLLFPRSLMCVQTWWKRNQSKWRKRSQSNFTPFDTPKSVRSQHQLQWDQSHSQWFGSHDRLFRPTCMVHASQRFLCTQQCTCWRLFGSSLRSLPQDRSAFCCHWHSRSHMLRGPTLSAGTYIFQQTRCKPTWTRQTQPKRGWSTSYSPCAIRLSLEHTTGRSFRRTRISWAVMRLSVSQNSSRVKFQTWTDLTSD